MMKFKSWAMLTVALAALAPAAAAAPTQPMAQTEQTKRQYKIAPQPLVAALNEFGRQSGRDILFSTEVAKQKRSSGVDGAMTAEDALRKLLDGTGLSFRATGDSTFLVEAADDRDASGSAKDRRAEDRVQPSAAAERTTDDGSVEKVTVTGSRIRGAKSPSPVVTITRDDMRRSGSNNVGDVARALPQNFNGGQNPGVALGADAGNAANRNTTGGSSFNLRGLGPDATLTLINGTRMPYDGFANATDVSVIPIAAIERIEVLLDGASAIYGSDAVGGVANIILRRDYEGAEFSARYGKATDGGYEQQQYTGVAGEAWATGGLLVAAEHSENTAVLARQRGYLGYISRQDDMIYPAASQTGALVSAHQRLGSFAELVLDAFYTERSGDAVRQPGTTILNTTTNDSTIWGIAPAMRLELSDEWSLRLHGVFGENDTGARSTNFFTSTGALLNVSDTYYINKAQAAGVELEGALFALPGGDARVSVGGGWRRNELYSVQNVNSVPGRPTQGREQSYYGYGELNLPLISEDQAIPLVSRLVLNGALRYEDYDSFGDTTTPKVGAIWGVTPEFDVKVSWGKSYKAPTLIQQHSSSILLLYDGPVFGAPAGTAVMAILAGNPTLGPEHAEITTAGFVARPEFLRGLNVELSWFNIDYTDRVIDPVRPLTQALTNPAFAEVITLSPTVAQQNAMFAAGGFAPGTFTANVSSGPYNPATVYAIVDDRYLNIAAQTITGIDLIASYKTEFLGGDLSLSANGSWIESVRRLTSRSTEQATSGVVYFPPEFRGRFGGSWSRDGLTISSNLNHIGDVTNLSVLPPTDGGTMTTVDLIVDYELEASSALGNVEFNVAVTNVFNERPPFLQPTSPVQVNFDSTNYSALGRVVSLTVTKRF